MFLALIFFICASIVVVGGLVFYGLTEMRSRAARLNEMEKELGNLRDITLLNRAGSSNIIRSLMSFEELMSVQSAVLEELATGEATQNKIADNLLYLERRRLLKSLHHSGLVNPDEQKALMSAWALATEFGEHDSLDLMKNLEQYRRPPNLQRFQAYASILESRLNG